MQNPKLSQDDWHAANDASLIDYLLQSPHHGLSFKKEGSRWYRCKEDKKIVVGVHNSWHDNGRDLHGKTPTSFLVYVLGMSWQEAVFALNGNYVKSMIDFPAYSEVKKDIGNVSLPEPNSDNQTVITYLTQNRKIDPSVVQTFLKMGLIYESRDYHNVVFVGEAGEDGKPRGYNERGTGPKRFFHDDENNDYDYQFAYRGYGTTLIVVESGIDLLSAATLTKFSGIDWREHSYLSEAGSGKSGVYAFLDRNPHITEVYIYTDRDKSGQQYFDRVGPKLRDKGLGVHRLMPRGNDPNDELKSYVEGERECGAEL
ncbi:DUF3991 and toprim domain-containing protein [Eubacteriales bacterium OttesenSCG-928-M02]|nr:DUF3991 and toprim domain-containing protein [Eubacteriales bacterium OttesenSCG-928-M02]